MTEIKPIQSIPGAFANSLGQIKMPEVMAEMPNGGTRAYNTKWISGAKHRASKNARHQYLAVMYRGRNYKIHRLVCEAFHGSAPFDRAIVLHLDENAMNNAPSNLRWGTQKENLNMPGFLAYCRSRTGENAPTVKGRKNVNK